MRKTDILADPLLDRPVSQEAARSRYERPSTKNKTEPVVQFESLAEARIKRAAAEGVFDNLPGNGQPIDLEDYYAVPEHLRIGYHMLKNAGCPPEEVRLKKDLESLKEKIQQCPSEEEKQKLVKELAEVSQR